MEEERKLVKEKDISGREHSQSKALTPECAWGNRITVRPVSEEEGRDQGQR